MNYYYPFFNQVPLTTSSTGLFSRLFGGIKLGSIIGGTQKTLNIINQTIPIIKQVSPMFKNAKTMFKVMNEFKKTDEVTTNKVVNDNTNSTIIENNNNPTFFI